MLGTPNNLGIWDGTNDECMPQLLNGTGAAQWGDVQGHPWTTGMQLDYFTEAGLWAEWLKTKFPERRKVAAITFNNDFGQSYRNGFRHDIKGSNIEVVDRADPRADGAEPRQPVHHAAASGAEVLLIETTGTYCTQAMAAVEKGDAGTRR